MNLKISHILVWTALISLLSCGGTPTESSFRQEGDSAINSGSAPPPARPAGFPYDLGSPSQKFKMPDELTEISAITAYSSEKLACVQDEKGEIFLFDLKKGEIKKAVDFGKKGDYEGIARVSDTLFVLSSNGNLHRISGFHTDQQKTDEFKTELDEKNDTEGLCYDAANRRLLIACKQNPGSGYKGHRAVYAFSLQTMTLDPKPVFLISIEAIKSMLLRSDKGKVLTHELQNLASGSEDVSFQPSEIAIHPLTREIYLISTVGKLLVVLDRGGTLRQTRPLDPDLMKQPEGLCFMEDGTLYISDEGRSGHGKILEFKYKP